MLNVPSFLWIFWVVFAAACAQTTEREPDGQTHWMTRCDESGDCSGLECICGVCTQPCSVEAACSELSDDAVCQDDLSCSSNGICVRADEPFVPGDGDGDGDGDSGIIVPSSLVQLGCVPGGAGLTGMGDYEVIASGTFEPGFTVANDGTIYGGIGAEGALARIDETGGDLYEPEIAVVRHVAVRGHFVMAVVTDDVEVRIIAVDRADDAQGVAARVPLPDPRTAGLAFDTDYMYWIGYLELDSPSRVGVWRTPVPFGETELLGEIMARPLDDTLVVLGDALYLLATDQDDHPRLFRGAKDGSTAFEVIDDMSSAPATEMRAFEGSLYLALEGDLFDRGGSVSGIGRMNPSTLEVETLFETAGHVPWFVTLGMFDPYVYWVINEDSLGGLDGNFSIWRGRKDGTGDAEMLALMAAWPFALQATQDSLYWITSCEDHGGGQQHLIKAALP